MRLTKYYYVYILASKKDGVLYIGITNNLVRRIWEHRHSRLQSFTKKYYVFKLVYYETFEDINEAIYREKCIKRWKRAWKIRLIEKENPEWKNLHDDFFD
jgi:putative endonuclease